MNSDGNYTQKTANQYTYTVNMFNNIVKDCLSLLLESEPVCRQASGGRFALAKQV